MFIYELCMYFLFYFNYFFHISFFIYFVGFTFTCILMAIAVRNNATARGYIQWKTR